jgi:hypothetical protein
MKVSGQLHAPTALSLGNVPSVHTELETGCAPELVRME